MSYDAQLRVVSTAIDADGHEFTHRVKYDSRYNRPIGQWYADGSLLETLYDPRTGDVVGQRDVRRDRVLYRVAALDSAGSISEQVYANGLRTQTVRYYSGQVQSICTGVGDSGCASAGADQTAQQLVYVDPYNAETGYDSFGNLRRVQDRANGYEEAYRYDDLHRLTQVQRRIGSGAAATVSYGYSANGNLLSKSDYGSVYRYGNAAKDAGGNAGPNAVREVKKVDGSTARFVYDHNGNQLSGDGRAVSYDVNNKPTQVVKAGVTSRFYYDAEGMRYKQVASGNGVTRTTYYGGGSEYVVGGGEAESRTYLGDWGLRVVSASGASRLRFIHRDRLGSVHTLSSGTVDTVTAGALSAVLERRAFDVFGGVLSSVGHPPQAQWLTARGFSGHEHVLGVGVIHMNGRGYDAALGRFLSVDPWIQSPHNGQSVNGYSYVMNNPLWGVDPSGYVSQAATGRSKPLAPGPNTSSLPQCAGLDQSCHAVEKPSSEAVFDQTQNGAQAAQQDKADKTPAELVNKPSGNKPKVKNSEPKGMSLKKYLAAVKEGLWKKAPVLEGLSNDKEVRKAVKRVKAKAAKSNRDVVADPRYAAFLRKAAKATARASRGARGEKFLALAINSKGEVVVTNYAILKGQGGNVSSLIEGAGAIAHVHYWGLVQEPHGADHSAVQSRDMSSFVIGEFGANIWEVGRIDGEYKYRSIFTDSYGKWKDY